MVNLDLPPSRKINKLLMGYSRAVLSKSEIPAKVLVSRFGLPKMAAQTHHF